MKTITKKPLISIVIPAYNEAKGIAITVNHIRWVLEPFKIEWEMIIVDDGSQDQTYQEICKLSQTDPRIKGMALSRNFGKESALLAGLEASNGDAVITIDGDLQHPPTIIGQMLDKWQSGIHIVHAIKRSRGEDSPAKQVAVHGLNQLISHFGKININNSSDFKLLDREIVDILIHRLPERQRFFRGLTSWLGFNEEYIYFDVAMRAGDGTKWSFWSLFELAVTALTSFTSMPLRIVTLLGFATLLLGFFIAGEALISYATDRAVSGFTTIIITLLLVGSFIMMSLGIIGEYIAKIYEEVKARPIYLVKDSVGISDNHDQAP